MAVSKTHVQERQEDKAAPKDVKKEKRQRSNRSVCVKKPVKLTLLEKLLQIRKSVKSVIKDVSGEEFSYCSHSMVLGSVREKMDELRVLLVPEILETVSQKNGEHQVKAKMKFTWINVDDRADKLEIDWIAYGSNNDISRAMGVLTTYATKDFILKQFQIPQNNEDPDAKGNKTKPSAEPEELNQEPGPDPVKSGVVNQEAIAPQPEVSGAPMDFMKTNKEIREEQGLAPDPICLKSMDWIDTECGNLFGPEEWEKGYNVISSNKLFVDASQSTQRAYEDYFIVLYNEFAQEYNREIKR